MYMSSRPAIVREHEPVRIRLNSSKIYNVDNQAVIVVDQDDEVPILRTAPQCLHEQFMHVWGYKVRVFGEPRRGPIAVNHQIIPEG